MKKILTLLIIMGGQLYGLAGGLYHVKDSPFATFIARNPGDILTVLVDEVSSTNDKGSRTLSRNNDQNFLLESFFLPAFNFQKGFTKTMTDGDSPVIDWNSSSSFDSSSEADSNHTFNTTFTVRIVEAVDEEHLVIRGQRLVNLNGKDKRLYLSGVIRQRDISKMNTISSSKIADAVVEIEGETGMKDVRPGIFNKIFNFIF